MRAAQRLWPQKTAENIASRADVKKRAAEYWLVGARQPNGEAMLRLITSGEEGVRIFEAYIASLPDHDRKQVWKWLDRAVRREKARERIRSSQAELEALGRE